MSKYTLLRLIVFVFFVLMGLLVLYELDLHYYQTEKWNYIQTSEKATFDNPTDTNKIATLLSYFGGAGTGGYREQHRAGIHDVLQTSVDGPGIFFRMELVDGAGDTVAVAESGQKLLAHNGFPDALFLKDFQKQYLKGVGSGTLRCLLTTPKNDPAIQRMTWRYLTIALVLFAAVMVPCVLIDSIFLRPYARVVGALDSAGDVPVLIRPGAMNLARRYNDIARDALLQGVEQFFQDPRRRYGYHEHHEVYADLPAPATRLLGYPWFLAAVLRRVSPSGVSVETPVPTEGAEPGSEAGGGGEAAAEGVAWSWEVVVARLSISRDDRGGAGARGASAAWPDEVGSPDPAGIALQLIKTDQLAEISRRAVEAQRSGRRVIPWLFEGAVLAPAACFASMFVDRTKPSHFILLLAGAPHGILPDASAWEEETFERLLAKVDRLLEGLALQQQLLARERSEANVSLARNLGHDLTNMIATSKLDMLALKSLVDKLDGGRPPRDSLAMIRETVDSLVNNTRFMQEIVDVYRSFSYLKRPTFERVDVNDLLDRTIEVFLLSTSLQIEVVRRYARDLEPIELEPRLIRLALFNLLNNALDAMKRFSGEVVREEGAPRWRPQLIVSTAATEDNAVALSVEDNGPGIRDERGVLLPPEELTRIFAMGYSTKAVGEGEGLGLNWVWTIVHDFHGGRVWPENPPSGGARLTLVLPKRARAARDEAAAGA